jgi:hypothetical protein
MSAHGCLFHTPGYTHAVAKSPHASSAVLRMSSVVQHEVSELEVVVGGVNNNA